MIKYQTLRISRHDDKGFVTEQPPQILKDHSFLEIYRVE
jgi:hypothetical protein